MLLLLSWLSAAAAIQCYNYTSFMIKLNQCAQRTDQTILLSANPCEGDTYCSAEEMLDFYNQYPDAQSYPCQKYTEAQNRTSYNETQTECGVRDKDTDLEQGSHPKMCESDDDCKQKNGSKTACECGLNGIAYCHPDFSCNVFDDYWDDCNNGKVGDSDLANYMVYLETIYPLAIDPADAAENLFLELITLKELEVKSGYTPSDVSQDDSSAAEVLLCSFLLIAG